jgi:uncharacterized protein (UPF0332 family)
MMTDNIRALVSDRLEQAAESLAAGKPLLEQGLFRPSIKRSSYAMFYSVLALLTTRREETSKHGRAIALFDKEFVKAGMFSKEFSRWPHEAFDLRQRSDYSPQFNATSEDARGVLDQATSFITEIKAKLTAMASS